MFNRFKTCFLAAGLAAFLSSAALAALPSIMDEKDVLPYLEQMIDWHRRAAALEVPAELPRLLLIRNALNQHANKALNAGFDFARALAAVEKDQAKPAPAPDVSPVAPAADGAPRAHRIKDAIHKAEQQIHDLQTALLSARDGAAHTSLDGQLRLQQEHLNLLKTIASSIGESADDTDTLEEKIDKLAETVPEVDGGGQKAGEGPAAVIPATPVSSGMAGLITDLYGFVKARQEVKTLRNETQAMLDISRERSRAIRAAMQDLMKQGADIGKGAIVKTGAPASGTKKPGKNPAPPPVTPAPKAADTAKPDPGKMDAASDIGENVPAVDGPKLLPVAADPAKPAPDAAPARPPTYDELLADMKKLTKVALPLSQQNVALDASVRDLTQWMDIFAQQMHDVTRRLLVRLGIMASIIFGLCLLSVLFGRATRRYVLDDRRKIQLKTVRKMVLITTISVVVFLGFFTDFSSLATFAGLITAGLAVSLQTVLLSLVAFFHFFGSFGIRVGDRITISGVTGRVMQIGMTRFYLMEMVRSDVGYLPTGRVVGFSNSILFQPLPFFRQTPGTNFVWSEISLTLDPSVDYESTHKKLQEVVTRVYTKQREIMRRQELALFNITHFKAEVSEPQMYLKITGGGLVLTIRYAVQREQESELHLQMTEELLSVIKKDPDLKFVNIG